MHRIALPVVLALLATGCNEPTAMLVIDGESEETALQVSGTWPSFQASLRPEDLTLGGEFVEHITYEVEVSQHPNVDFSEGDTLEAPIDANQVSVSFVRGDRGYDMRACNENDECTFNYVAASVDPAGNLSGLMTAYNVDETVEFDMSLTFTREDEPDTGEEHTIVVEPFHVPFE